MGRIFGIIAGISALMIMLVGSGTYWFSAADAKNAKREAVDAIVNNLSTSLSMQMDTLQKSVDGLAQAPEVIAALSSGNPEIIKATAAKLQTTIPHNLRLRLLLPTVNDLDESQMPHMGFGDLEMMRATLTGKPSPVIQGDADDRHLAVTSAVSDGQRVVGVVLASINPDLPKQLVSRTQIANGFIELKQDQVVLASLGKTVDKSADPTSIPVANTRWKIETWVAVGASLGDMGLLGAIIGIPALMGCLAFFIGYRKLTDFFRQDQSSILKAAKDMIQGKQVGNYPMQLEEMQPIIAAMAQFKRVISQGNQTYSKGSDENKDAFFEESFDLDFLEDTTPIETKPLESAPISVSNLSSPVADEPGSDEWQSLSQDIEATPAAPIPESWDMEIKPTTAAKAYTSDRTVAASATVVAPSKPATTPMNIFHDYDISGVVGKGLDEDIIANLGRAFASEAKQLNVKTIVVARDGRASSPALAQALINGIVSTGCDVLDIGLVPTPVLCFVSHHSEGRTGIMVTGSDLSAEYNGLKMVLHGEPTSTEHIQRLKARIASKDYSLDQAGSVEQNTLFSNEYIGIISEDTHIVRPMTVVVECGNGATSQLGPMLLKTIGCDVVELNCDIGGQLSSHKADSSNPNDLEALIKAVKLNNADVGIAFSGDGDRLSLVDSSGRIIWPDRQMMLFARDVLASKPGAEIIFDAACSKHLPAQIKKRGGYPVLWQSGRSPLQARLRETGAAMAADISGHFLFNDRWFGFADALYAAVRMIGILSADMRSSSELFNELPDNLSTPEMHVMLAEGENTRFIEQLFSQAQFSDAMIVDTDGMRAEFPDGWGLVRASKTKPALELRFEADNHEAMQRIQSRFKALLLKINPDLSLPF